MSSAGEKRHAAPVSPETKLPTSLKIGWAAGSAGTGTLLYLINTALLAFMTDQLGIEPAVAGTVILFTRIYDMVSDPIVGILSDRTKSRWGRRRPWLAAGTILSALSCVVIFSADVSQSGGQIIGYMALGLVIYFTGYTMFNVPYLAMPAEMTSNMRERTSLVSYRVFFVAMAGILGTALPPALLEAFGADRQSYVSMSYVIALIVLILMSVTVIATTKAPSTKQVKADVSMKEALRTALRNRPFFLLISVKLLQLFGLASTTATVFYFIPQILERGFLGITYFGLGISLSTAASLPFWVRLTQRMEKQKIYALSVAIYVVLTLSWLLAGPQESDVVFYARIIGLGITSGGFLLMGQSLLPDTIEYDFHLSGQRREGVFSSASSFVEKTSFTFAPFLIGLLLSAMGYQESTGEVIEQSESAVRAVYIAVGVIPSVAAALSIPLLLAYDLTEDRLIELRRKSKSVPG